MYRSVLLNNGPRVRPQPDTSSGPSHLDQPTSEAQPTISAQSERQPSKHTPVEQLLYRDDIPVGSRGDIIQFYNKLFIGFIKDFVLKFSPSDDVSCIHSQSCTGGSVNISWCTMPACSMHRTLSHSHYSIAMCWHSTSLRNKVIITLLWYYPDPHVHGKCD